MNKKTAISVALILILTFSTAMAIMPVKAQTSGVGGVNTYTATPTRGAGGLWNFPTFAGITASPDPAGVGQPMQIIMLIEQLPPSQGYEAITGTYGGWPGLMLTVTDPTGNKTTLGPYETDVSGTYQVTYTPTMTGTYSFQFTWNGLQVGNGPGMVQGGSPFVQYWANFQGSTSNVATVTVQQAPLTGFTEAPVPSPTQYWTVADVNAQNRAWNVICGPWLQSGYNATGLFNPYTYPVKAPHILWTQNPYVPFTASAGTQPNGGLVGGAYGSLAFTGMNSALSGFSLVCVMNGYAYYNGPTQSANVTQNGLVYNAPVSYFYCMNIQTGQIAWSKPGSISCGQILCERAQQTKQCEPFLWSLGGTYKCYSANTGDLVWYWGPLAKGATIYTSTENGMSSAIPGTTIAPTAVTPTTGVLVLEQPNPAIVGQNVGYGAGGGALLEYIYGRNAGASTGYLMCWNSSLAIDSIANDPTGQPNLGGFTIAAPSIYAQTTTTPLDWNWGIMWNVTVPLVSTTGSTSNGTTVTSSLTSWSLIGCDAKYCVFQSGASGYNATGYEYRSLAAMEVDNLPMTTTYTEDVGGTTINPTAGTLAWVENYSIPTADQTYTGTAALQNGGVITINDSPLLCIWGFSESTGALLWTSTPYNNAFSFQSYAAGVAGNGIYYNPGYDGYLHAINETTGVQMWSSITRPGGLEMPEAAYPCTGSAIIAGTPSDSAVYLSTTKSYEAQPLYRGHTLYAYDGQTGAQLWNISGEFSLYCLVDGILLGGNKYDNTVYAFGIGQSATTVTAPQTSVASGSSCIIQGTVTDQTPGKLMGTPAISDAYMGAWMAYMYMDQACPTTATGVTVTLSAIDPNGNYISIGSATSDTTGTYHFTWAPPNIPGTYTIIASFGGSYSYGGSTAETTTYVGLAPTAAPAATATPTSTADMYFVPAIAGLFVLIVIVAIVLAMLMLRKRP